jgi:hypothetical protein
MAPRQAVGQSAANQSHLISDRRVAGTLLLCYVRTVATIKEAVDHASRFAQGTLGPERTAGLRLEEVESANASGEDAWLITLSMADPAETVASERCGCT